MTPESDLPVFSFRANWRDATPERLSFRTDIMSSDEGVEQRRAVRQTPRRSFELDLLLVAEERTFWDLFVDGLAGGEMMAPLVWEGVTLPATLNATVTDRVNFDTTYREWAYQDGGLAILCGATALDYEVVQIAAVDSAGVDLVDPPVRTWRAGTQMFPLRRCVFEQRGSMSQPSAAVARVAVELRVVGANPWEPAVDPSPVFSGLPVFTQEPNWVEDLSVDYARLIDVADVGIGRTYQRDVSGRSLVGQAHRWFLDGRAALAQFRDTVYRNLGRTGVFWLPTFKADLALAAPVAAGSSQIVVKNVGYRYTGAVRAGREYIAVKHSGGLIFRRIVSAAAGTTTSTEKLNLDSPIGLDLSPGQDLRISFMDTARFDSDDFEITHHAGIDGLHEVSALFRTVKNTRTSPEPIYYPIPETAMNSTPCGESEFPPTEGFALIAKLAFTGTAEDGYWPCEDFDEDSVTVGGDPSIVYDLTIRIRGVFESVGYSSGDAWPPGPAAVRTNTTTFSNPNGGQYYLEVTDDTESMTKYSFNHGRAFDIIPDDWNYEITIPVRGGSTLRLVADSTDGLQRGHTGVSVPDVDGTILVTQPYAGQFIQVDGDFGV